MVPPLRNNGSCLHWSIDAVIEAVPIMAFDPFLVHLTIDLFELPYFLVDFSDKQAFHYNILRIVWKSGVRSPELSIRLSCLQNYK